MVLPTCVLVSIRSSRTTAISGAMPNQPKKHRKKANHVMWNARICGVLRLNRLIRVALFRISTVSPPLGVGAGSVFVRRAGKGARDVPGDGCDTGGQA